MTFQKNLLILLSTMMINEIHYTDDQILEYIPGLLNETPAEVAPMEKIYQL